MQKKHCVCWTILGIVSLAANYAVGQTLGKSKYQTTTLKASAELVQVPVLVNRSGKHVAGLAKSDFIIQQDGREQPIATFEEVHAVAPTRSINTGQEFGNTSAVDRQQQIAIIAIDTVNTPVMDQSYFKQELLKFLSHAAETRMPFGLVELTRNGVRVLHDFTTDPSTLLAAVQNRRSTHPTRNDDKSPLLGEAANEAAQQVAMGAARAERMFNEIARLQENEYHMAQFQDRTARIDSLRSLQQLAQALKGLPGRKTLVWVGPGYQFLGGVQRVKGIRGVVNSPLTFGETMDQNTYTWKLLNDANVAVYPIDTRRTANPEYEVMGPSQKYSPLSSETEMARQKNREVVATFQAIAAETGGRPCIARTDLQNCLREAVEDNLDYYILGFYVDKNSGTRGWHTIKVKLNQKANVRFRSGFLIADGSSDALRDMDLQLALHSPLNYTALLFHGRFTDFIESGRNRTANFELTIPPGSVTIENESGRVNFDVLAVARAAGGTEVARVAQRIDRKLTAQDIADIAADGIRYRNKVNLDAGEYGVWFVVRDNLTGRIGSSVGPLKVP